MAVRYKTYRVAPEALSQAQAFGLGKDAANRLSRMARRSTTFTSDLGNRRFDEFVLTVEEDLITRVERMTKEEVAHAI